MYSICKFCNKQYGGIKVYAEFCSNKCYTMAEMYRLNSAEIREAITTLDTEQLIHKINEFIIEGVDKSSDKLIEHMNAHQGKMLIKVRLQSLEDSIINVKIPTDESIEKAPNVDYAKAYYQGVYNTVMNHNIQTQEKIDDLKRKLKELEN